MGFLLLFGAVAARAGEAPRPLPPAPAGLSWEASQSLRRKLEDIEKRRAAGKLRAESVLVTEGELNSYLNLDYGPKLPRGLTDVSVRLEHDRITARGLLDVDRLKGKAPASGTSWTPFLFLTGKVPVEMKGRLSNLEGFGQIELEEVWLAALPVPTRVLDQLVASATRTPQEPAGFDIRAPFRFPYSVRRVRLEPGRARLEF